jgi:hypothetical protein
VKQIWSGPIAQSAAKYGEIAPTATVCCNACRTCVTSNLLGAGLAGLVVAGNALAGVVRRLANRRGAVP